MDIKESQTSRQIVAGLDMGWPFSSEVHDSDIIYLRDNENPFGGIFNRYPHYQRGRDSLSESYLRLIVDMDGMNGGAGCALEVSNILLTQGAGGALEQVFKACFEPGVDVIALTSPAFSVFSRLATIYKIGVCTIPLQGEGFDRLDIQALCESNAKGVVLCDPNNPIGSRIHPDDVVALLESFTGWVIIDEAYVEYSRQCSNLRHLRRFPQLVILRTMSKALGMAGLRIGAAMGAADTIEALRRVQLPFSTSEIAADWCQSALENRRDIRLGIEKFRIERDRVYDELRRLPYLSGLWGEDSGFLTLRTSRIDELVQALEVARIKPVINPAGLQGFIRISIGTAHENDCVIKSLKSLV